MSNPLKLIDRLRIYEAEVAAAMQSGRDVDASFGLLQVLQSSIELCERSDSAIVTELDAQADELNMTIA